LYCHSCSDNVTFVGPNIYTVEDQTPRCRERAHVRAVTAIAACLVGLAAQTAAFGGDNEPITAGVTLIHTGDFHGHLVGRPNVRSDTGDYEGGLARINTLIKQIRREDPRALLIHTGDTIQGSAEALFTKGQAIVDVVNMFGVDAFAPGNWDYVYGSERFLELFAGPKPMAPWNAIAANVYYSTLTQDPKTPYPERAGQRVLPPYIIKHVGKVKVGILGLTTDRGPQVVGRAVTKGLNFLKNGAELDAEVAARVKDLRETEKVHVLVMASEMGLANNIRLAEKIPGIDVILSSDMHETTPEPIVASTGTVIVEEGQDGTVVGKLVLQVKNGKLASWRWKPYTIDRSIKEDPEVAAKIRAVRASFVSGPAFTRHVNPFNGSVLKRPIDTVVGYTAKPLHRSNFSDQPMAAVIEGSSHDFLTDAFRIIAGADIGAIRGFRYGTHVPRGPIRQEDLYHFVPIGPQIAIGTITGQALKNQIENAADGTLNPDVSKWTGGWLFNFSGVTMELDPYAAAGNRANNIRVAEKPLDLSADYTYASYWYQADPGMINTVPAGNITVLKEADGAPLDATEVIVKYLASLPNQLADPVLDRINVLTKLPAPVFKNREIQPLRGARSNTVSPANAPAPQ